MKTPMKLMRYLLLFIFVNAYANNNSAIKNWVAKHDMSGQKYNDAYKDLKDKGLVIDYIDGHYINGKVRYAAIWKKGDPSKIFSKHGLTGSEYQTLYSDLKSKGFRLIHIDGYATGNGVRYAAIWKKKNTDGIRTSHGLTASQYKNEFDKNHEDGYRLIRVSGYEFNGSPHYAAIWKKGDTSNYKTHHKVSDKNYQQVASDYISQGYAPIHVNAYSINGKGYYACIFKKKSVHFSSRHGLSPKNYQLEAENHYYQGFKPVCVSAYDAGNEAAYAAIFVNVGGWRLKDTKQLDKKVKKLMKEYGIVGASIGIVKDGKLKYAKGYGYGVKNEEIASATSLFRLASVSKPITAAAVMKLVQQDKLNLNDKIFGNNSLLGKKYGDKPYSNREKNITLKHLLEHTAGGHAWDNERDPEGIDTLGAIMIHNKNKNMKYKNLIGAILDKRNPSAKPGKLFQYSNFGYCLLGRIIKKESGQSSYEAYVRKKILKPCGITEMYVAGNDKKDRRYREVKYYSENGNAYNNDVKLMDSHGGWIGSSVDLMRFVVRIDGDPSKKDILNEDSTTSMFTPHTIDGKEGNYAKGWWYLGSDDFEHGGNITGTQTYIRIMGNGISYVFLANTGKSGLRNAMRSTLKKGIDAVEFWPDIDLF